MNQVKAAQLENLVLAERKKERGESDEEIDGLGDAHRGCNCKKKKKKQHSDLMSCREKYRGPLGAGHPKLCCTVALCPEI